MNRFRVIAGAAVTVADLAAGEPLLLDEPVRFGRQPGRPQAGPAPDAWSHHLARYGPLPAELLDPASAGRDAEACVELFAAHELAGRGGGHFPVAAKWRAALTAGAGDRAVAGAVGRSAGCVVVGNGAEGEPASAKDAALLQLRPHLVLDGLCAAAALLGAQRAVLWLHEGAADTQQAVKRALRERADGARAPGAGPVAIEVATGPDSYLTGEASAVVRALSGGPALPAFRRVPAAVSGVAGRPTVVHNVETLARIALLLRGAAGADTTLITVASAERRTVLEVDPATTVAEAIAFARQGEAPGTSRSDPLRPADSREADQPQAVLLGGYGGRWLGWAEAAQVPLQHRALRAAGAGLGAGIVLPLGRQECGVEYTATVLDYLAQAGARQCGPCLFGLRAIADLMLELADGRGGRGHLRRVQQYAGEIDGRGACHHPDGAVGMLHSAIRVFAADLEAHARRGRCLITGGPR